MRTGGRQTNQLRATARINAKLEKNLGTYMTVGAAAGVGILALAQSAEATIVYTPANIVLNTQVMVDFDNDGVTDLTFSYSQRGYGGYWFAKAGNNAIMNAHNPSSVLPWGKRIGPAAAFVTGSVLLDAANFHSTCHSAGNWINKKGFYLGLKFTSGGETHYGWARLSVGTPCSGASFKPLLTGYAYETVPNKPIIAGKTSGFAATQAADPNQLLAPSGEPASLGLLALGHSGLEIWRRD